MVWLLLSPIDSLAGTLPSNFAGFLVLLGAIIWLSFRIADHAGALATCFGEPYGTMILVIAGIVVECLMVTTVMMHADDDPFMARDTIYAGAIFASMV
ncbi:MAG: hypothetical protein JKX97_03485 [Candidatus Lindowbacteria bacterium]|nr:hypothetical protein [Candidatus Lindowbacteria bacterium]